MELKFTTTKLERQNQEILLEMVDDRLHIVYGELFDHIISERLLSPKETSQELKHLEDLQLSSWAHEYLDESQPGEAWKLTRNGEVYQGRGTYPDNYADFIAFLDRLVPEAALVDLDAVIDAFIVCDQELIRITPDHQLFSYKRRHGSKLATAFEIHDGELVDTILSVLNDFNADVFLASYPVSRYVSITIAQGDTFVYDYNAKDFRHLMIEIDNILDDYFEDLPIFDTKQL